MTPQSVSRRYANALFDVAAKNSAVAGVQRDLSIVQELLASHEELRNVFEARAVPPQKKRDILKALLQKIGGIAPETFRLLTFLADRDRLMLIDSVATAFQARARTAARIVSAEVVTAVPLGDAGRTALTEALAKATGLTVTMTERVDPAIIGGVIASVGSLVFDGSVTRQIERMREKLLADA